MLQVETAKSYLPWNQHTKYGANKYKGQHKMFNRACMQCSSPLENLQIWIRAQQTFLKDLQHTPSCNSGLRLILSMNSKL